MIQWSYFPQSSAPPRVANDVIECFRVVSDSIDSTRYDLPSNEVLAQVRQPLTDCGFRVENGRSDKVHVPVLFGRNGRIEKAFEADAWDAERRLVLEVEAGRGVLNNQFLKDLFQACVMQDVDYLAVAVRNDYKRRPDFETVCTFIETLYASRRLDLPLTGILILGY